jgi:hypothetical protein
MKAEQAPEVPGNTPWERLDNAVKRVLNVPKEVMDKEVARTKRVRRRKRAKRNKPK